MPRASESPADVQRWFQTHVAGLWPAALGSLSLRRSPCVREHCRACRAGDQHTSHVVYGRVKGRRFALYIPEALVPEVRRGLDHGRALQDLLAQAALRYIRALKLERTTTLKKKKG